MPPTGFHGLIGLLIAGKLNSKPIKIGFAWGSVFPDLDLLGSIFAFLLTQNRDLTIYMHRSVTHSIIIMLLILIGGYFVVSFQKYTHRDVYLDLMPFLLGLTTGMLLHVFLDFFYLGGVALLWPLQPMNERFILLDYTYEDLTPVYNNLLPKIVATLDGGFEAIYYLVFVHLGRKLNTDEDVNLGIGSFSLTVNNWYKKLTIFAYSLIVISVIFITMAFLSINWAWMGLEEFIVILYIPLSVVYLLTGFLPLIMRDTVEKINF